MLPSGDTSILESALPDYVSFILRCLLFACVHSLFAANRIKQAISRIAGGEPLLYRLVYNLASLVMFGWVMLAWQSSGQLYAATGAVRWLLHAAQAATAVLILRCVLQTGAGYFLGISQFSGAEPPHTLITCGCYSLVRHPLYLYSSLFLLLNPVMTVKWCLLTIFSITYFVIGGIIEERRLLLEFGDEYRTYRERVPFLLPGIPFTRRPGHKP